MSGLLINANSLNIPLADGSVQCVVTSPPYYGLRDYGTAKWEGGDPNCDHKYSTARNDGGRVNTSGFHGSAKEDSDKGDMNYRGVCPKCGAIRIDEQIGLEQTPDEYIANLVAVFRECKRILRDDGTLWVNIGDSYTSDGFNRNSVKLGSGIQADQRAKNPDYEKQTAARGSRYYLNCGLKAKDLIGIPWMLAFALRADGWYLRQDIIWAKPNPMPESVKDRCTKSHEYIFLLSKSAKYYYDNEAVMEDAAGGRERFGGAKYGDKGLDKSRNDTARFDETIVSVRNKRDVWTVTTKPYKGAHYATFNPELIKPCILAGAPEGGIVFDPFVGSGTTVATAIQLGRKGIGIDLSFKYLQENAKARVESAELPLLNFIEQ